MLYYMLKKTTKDKSKKKYVDKEKKPFYKRWWFWIIILILFSSAINSPSSDSDADNTNVVSTFSSSQKVTSSSMSKQESLKSNNSSQKFKADRLKLGTTKEEVIRKIGKPIDSTEGMLTYNGFALYFENNKLVGGNLPKLQKKVNASIEKKKESESQKKQDLYNYAKIFGQIPVSELQKYSENYSSQRIGNDMMYVETAPNEQKYIRIDDNNGFSTVYLYDANSKDCIGQQMYQGKTILQPEKKNEDIYIYNQK